MDRQKRTQSSAIMLQLLKYFPGLTIPQLQQFTNLEPLYAFWNDKINLISRADVHNLAERHVLHSLSIAKVVGFRPGTRILDLGTGGGFPGIPLAIMFPLVQFHMIDVVEKKTRAVFTIANDLGLRNIRVEKLDGRNLNEQYDYIVSRAVTDARTIYDWTHGFIGTDSRNDLPNGILLLKGGELDKGLGDLDVVHYKFPISNFFKQVYYDDKYVLYISV